MKLQRATGPARAVLVGGVVACLAALAVAAPASADPGAGTDKASRAASSAVQSAPDARTCTQRPSAGKSTNDEYLSCLGVSARLDRVPSVGESATLTAT